MIRNIKTIIGGAFSGVVGAVGYGEFRRLDDQKQEIKNNAVKSLRKAIKQNGEQNEISSKSKYYINHESQVVDRAHFACDPALSPDECDEKFNLLQKLVTDAKIDNNTYYQNNTILNHLKKILQNETNTHNLKTHFGDSFIQELEGADFRSSTSMKELKRTLFPDLVFPSAPFYVYEDPPEPLVGLNPDQGL